MQSELPRLPATLCRCRKFDRPAFSRRPERRCRAAAIRPGLILNGSHEDDLVRFFAAQAREDSHCLDVGANYGFFACLLGKYAPRGKVVAIEPHPAVFRLLRDNIHFNDVAPVVAQLRDAGFDAAQFLGEIRDAGLVAADLGPAGLEELSFDALLALDYRAGILLRHAAAR